MTTETQPKVIRCDAIDRHRLKQARENAGLSQGQLARLLNISKADLVRIEDEMSQIPQALLPTILKCLRVSPPWLAGKAVAVDLSQVTACICGPVDSEDRQAIFDYLLMTRGKSDEKGMPV